MRQTVFIQDVRSLLIYWISHFHFTMSQNTLPETAIDRTSPEYWAQEVQETAPAKGTAGGDDFKYSLTGLAYNLGRRDHETENTDVSHTSALGSQVLKSAPGHSQANSGRDKGTLLVQLEERHRRQTVDHRREIV